MTLFTTLLVLIFGCLSKLGKRWRFDYRLEVFLRWVKRSSFECALGMIVIVMDVTFLLSCALQGVLFNAPMLLMWLLAGLLRIGAGKVRLHYHTYLIAAPRNDSHTRATMVGELTIIHGVPADCDERGYSRELQNALLWINFRFYLAPLFWLVVGGTWEPVTLMGYAFLHAR